MTARVSDVTDLGHFSFKWPAGTESFERGWDFVADYAGSLYRLRHGLGRRSVYGRERVHSVTWSNGIPLVEGVEADDYPQSAALLSVLRYPDGKHIRLLADVPAEYEDTEIVVHSDEIVAPHSRHSLAVKIRQDDLATWALHAILRLQSKRSRKDRSPPRRRGTQERVPTRPAALQPCEGTDKAAIVRALLEYGSTQAALDVDVEPSFTPNREANSYVIEDPFAFLIAVIFDQQIRAERAWEAPYLLRERLGNLDPAQLVADPDAVARAISQAPKLHRFVNNMAKWVVAAARRVLTIYGGDASRIWNDAPAANELQRRLQEFVGIDQKKSSMAVEILERDLGVHISELKHSDIAYDIHVRRVFLRTCLADSDDLAHMVQVARQLHPERPGEIDFPAWLIGRKWCVAGTPDCPECPLSSVCPKAVARAASVIGI